jgi:hypothetical protein
VSFADHATGRIYLMIAAGVPVWADRAAFEAAITDAETRAGLFAVLPSLFDRPLPEGDSPRYLAGQSSTAALVTLGAWGPSRDDASPR